MQRRRFLKWLLPLALLPVGVVVTRKLLSNTSCHAQDLVTRLKPFADVELGKKADIEVGVNDIRRFDTLCEQGFENAYRKQVVEDFTKCKIKNIDGWILSETEAFTHRVVYQSTLHLHN